MLVTVHKGGVAPRGKQTWQRELLSIPTVAPSHLRGCKIIDIQYCLEVRRLLSRTISLSPTSISTFCKPRNTDIIKKKTKKKKCLILNIGPTQTWLYG